jgi:hypothetical protein
MACDCIERKEAELREITSDPEAFIETAFDIATKTRGFHAKAFYRTKVFRIFLKNFSSAYLRFDYCPFCGEKYVNNDVSVKRIYLKRNKVTVWFDFPKGTEHDAFVNRYGRVYLQDPCGGKVYLKPRDFTEVGHA